MSSAIQGAIRIPRGSHQVSRRHISDKALEVMARLRGRDYQAYLVGGAVRDLLLGGRPKDFDVATDATPEQVCELFRGARIIGRRFRIAHVRLGREVIEVTTFRGHHEGGEPGPRPLQAKRLHNGVLVRDNVYGSLEEDAARRDFTVNALYYSGHSGDDFAILDFVDGLRDIERRRMRVIGEPEKRYREDPVRMLRAVRFAAKLGFAIESGSAAPITELACLLEAIPSSRLFDEAVKLFMGGSAERTFALLREYRLLEHMFPATASAIEDLARAGALVRAAMASTDSRIAEGKPVTPGFVLAALLWPPATGLARQLEAAGKPPVEALNEAALSIVAEQMRHMAIPRRFVSFMREVWELQPRLQSRRGKRARLLVGHRRFRAAYDFLLLREQSGEELDGLGQYWTKAQAEFPPAKKPLAGGGGFPARGRRRRPLAADA